MARALVATALLSLTAATLAAEPVAFEWFEYTGRDPVFEQPLPAGHFRNPILPGFYPDPSVVRVGDRFYLINSTFAYLPGIPVFESRDLVHWRQIGNVIDRPEQIDFKGLGVSRGIFAPAIEHHQDTFYMITTAVDRGGNFYMTAKNAAGPWSQPTWLAFDGIDPSFFFDGDGKAYVVNNGPPAQEPLYDGHRAIWIQAFDVARGELIGPRKLIVDGGTDIARKPIWIEGPHLFKREGWYYLTCAEGGTGENHSQVIFRSRSAWGPYAPYEHNPILTQRDLPADRVDPIVNAGHADLVEAPDGSWWAVFLASRAYAKGHYNTGRETFLLPVTWKDGWPVILDKGRPIPYVQRGPAFMDAASQSPLAGNFTWRDEFDGKPDTQWVQLRTARKDWYETKSGALQIAPGSTPLTATDYPTFLARRQQHMHFNATTRLRVPQSAGVSAGIAAFQNETHWYFFSVRRAGQSIRLDLNKAAGGAARVIASAATKPVATISLRISGDAGRYSFSFDAGDGWQTLKADDDATHLSTDVAGGFVGTMLGMYALESTREAAE